ncbi:MAG TPA: oligoendopeptidase F, partial [Anaerolineales bacterium]|nr:oligoendopeptidase F [Anaerolineales bacterium]
MAYKLSKWDLSDLYPGAESAELQNAFDMIEEQVTSFEGVRNKLSADMSADQFVEVLKASDSITRVGTKLYSFAGLSFTADTQDQKAQALQGRVQQFVAEIQNRMLFFSLW